MKHWQFEAVVTNKGRTYVDTYQLDADNLTDAFKKAKEYFGGKYSSFEIFGYNFLWDNLED